MSGSDDQDLFEDAGPRSIFAAGWFRVVLVLIVCAVIGAVSVPYILDYMNPPPKPTMASRPPVPVARPNAAASPVPAPPPQPSVPTARPVQPVPQTAMPAQPPPPAAAPVQPTPPPAMPAQKPPAAVAPASPSARATLPAAAAAPVPAPALAQAQKSVLPEAKADAKDEKKPGPEVTATKVAAAKTPVAKRAVAKPGPVAASGSYWVQVGAFRDENTAKQVAAKVGGPNVVVMSTRGGEAAPAAEAKEPAGGSDLYDVFVSGGAPPDIVRRLAGKGLASDPTAGGVVVRPSQPLRDAVALSKDLAVDGFKVQVRRAPGAAPRPAPSRPAAAAAPAAPASASGETLYRVRVGPYADRAAATVALRDLDGKGYKGFIARGEQ